MEIKNLLESLASYVPHHVLQQLLTDPAVPNTPQQTQISAVVLYAELFGLDELADYWMRHGENGEEKLIQTLNAYFWQMIDEISSHGGDIINCSGNSLVVIWPIIDGEQAQASKGKRAAQCALALKKALHNYAAPEGLLLSLRTGIDHGTLRTLRVGGALGRWEFLVSGECLTQARALSQHAHPGEILLSKRVQTSAEAEFIGETRSQCCFQLEDTRYPLQPIQPQKPSLVPEMDSSLRCYIPGAVLNQLNTKQIDWLAELRPLSILNVNVPTINFKTDLEKIQDLMHTLQMAIYRQAGSISSLTINNGGMTLVAAFGLPPLAHENDAARSVQAAINVHSQLQEKGVDSSIGLASGLTFCGAVGTPHRREYTMIGSVVNLAAHLKSLPQDAALGPIRCDPVTYTEAQNTLDQETLSGVTMKASLLPTKPKISTGNECLVTLPSRPEVEPPTVESAPPGITPQPQVTEPKVKTPAWQPQPIPAEKFHRVGKWSNINRAPHNQVSGVTYKRALSIKSVSYTPADAAPEMPTPWQGHGSAIVRWLFSEQTDTEEHLLEGARFAFLHDTVLQQGASTGQRTHPNVDEIIYVVAGHGVIYHRPTDGSPVIARPLRPGDAVLVRGCEYHNIANESAQDDLRIIVLGLNPTTKT